MAMQTEPKMSVRVMYRNNWFGGDGWTYFPVDVQISIKCPACGGDRGMPKPHHFCEDGDWMTVDAWENPCGHKDLYADVLREAGYKR